MEEKFSIAPLEDPTINKPLSEERSQEEHQENPLPVEASEETKESVEIKAPAISVNTEVAPPEFTTDKTQSFEAQMKDYLMATASVAAVEDEETRKAVLQKKSDEMVLHSEVEKKKELIAEREAEKKLQDAKAEVHSGIANKAAITEKLPTWMQIILFPILGALQCVFYLAIGAVGSLCSIALDVVSMVAKKFVDLTDSARKLFWRFIITALIVVFFFVLASFLERYNIYILPWKW